MSNIQQGHDAIPTIIYRRHALDGNNPLIEELTFIRIDDHPRSVELDDQEGMWFWVQGTNMLFDLPDFDDPRYLNPLKLKVRKSVKVVTEAEYLAKIADLEENQSAERAVLTTSLGTEWDARTERFISQGWLMKDIISAFGPRPEVV